jgi:hypothetical protein
VPLAAFPKMMGRDQAGERLPDVRELGSDLQAVWVAADARRRRRSPAGSTAGLVLPSAATIASPFLFWRRASGTPGADSRPLGRESAAAPSAPSVAVEMDRRVGL